MFNEKGITLISLAVTVIILGALMALTLNMSAFNDLIVRRFEAQNEYNEVMQEVQENIDSIQDQWGDLL